MRLFIVSSLFVVGLLSACDRTQPDLLAAAQAALQARDPATARVQLKQWLQAQPASAEGRYLLGTLLLEQGEWAAAAVELDKAAQLGHPKALVLPALARALLQQREHRALLQRMGAITLPDAQADADLATSLARAHFALQQTDEGQAALERALRQRPDFVPARLLQVARLASRGDRTAALQQLDELAAHAGPDPTVWLARGDLLADMAGPTGDAASALAAYEQAIRRGGDALHARTAMLNLLVQRRQMAAAQQQWAALRAAHPQHAQTRYFEAVLALHRGDIASARAAAEPLLAGAPTHPLYQRLVGTVALEAGEWPKAATHLAAALQNQPGDPSLRRLLTLVLLRSGDAERALQTIRPLLHSQPPDAEALALAAMAHLQNQQPLQARPLFQAAARQAPQDPRVRATLAMGRLASGEGDGALAELQQLAATPAGADAALALVRVHLQRQRWEAAQREIDQLERRWPQSPTAAMLRGEMSVRRGDVAAARGHYQSALRLAPAHFPATLALAELDVREHQPERARERFNAVLARDPRHRPALVALAALGEMTGAPWQDNVALLRRAIEAEPPKFDTYGA
ncbi:MAG: XrtA/PEP-CTERM system TPR-repeat protein PrsT [Inhella sp.]|uniref:XrtA/PEP-CTERM system TPR-repeat protein PrsT n=1 Tax=Inhella sp. TaxID=1921806 RepID=UPI003918C94B